MTRHSWPNWEADDVRERLFEIAEEEYYIELESFDEHYGDEIDGNTVGMRLA